MRLEKGMKIYEYNRFCGLIPHTIARVTKTQAIINDRETSERRFDREVLEESGFYAKGYRNGLDAPVYRIETPARRKAYEKQELIKNIKSIDFKMLDLDKLIEITDIINR